MIYLRFYPPDAKTLQHSLVGLIAMGETALDTFSGIACRYGGINRLRSPTLNKNGQRHEMASFAALTALAKAVRPQRDRSQRCGTCVSAGSTWMVICA